MNIYVAAAFGQAQRVKEIHARLAGLGVTPVSSWVDRGDGQVERLDEMTGADLAEIIEENDAAVASADVIMVLSSLEAKETFAEARYALSLGRLVLWVGEPRPLSAYRQGVVSLPHVETALCFLEGYMRADGALRRPLSRRLALVR